MGFTVELIKKRAISERKLLKGKRYYLPCKDLNVGQIRIYCDQVLFLCEEIEKLRKKLKD